MEGRFNDFDKVSMKNSTILAENGQILPIFLANDVMSNDAHWDLQPLSVSRFLAPETYVEYYIIRMI